MNHSFIAAAWNKLVCAKCAIPEFNLANEATHSDSVTCEACSNVGPVNKINKMLICASCESKELATPKSFEQTEAADKLSLEQVLNQVNRILETNQIVNADNDSVKTILDEAIRGNIKEYKDFFNAQIPSITELKKLVDEDESIEPKQKHYALMSLLKRRVQYLAMVLFQTRASQIEIGSEMKSIQFYMEKTIPELRMKLRAEFALNTPNYTPQVIHKSREAKPRPKNTQDKLAENYAKMMKIPIETARKLLANKLRDECTCSETPGMCKVHDAIAKEVKK